MISARQGYTVTFMTKPTEKKRGWSEEPVAAWDDDGIPLVSLGHGLKRATDVYSLSGVEVIDWSVECDGGIHILPGGGWMITVTEDDGTPYSFPVVAWQISSDGYGHALTTDGEGLISEQNSSKAQFWHPACQPTWRTDTEAPT